MMSIKKINKILKNLFSPPRGFFKYLFNKIEGENIFLYVVLCVIIQIKNNKKNIIIKETINSFNIKFIYKSNIIRLNKVGMMMMMHKMFTLIQYKEKAIN